MKKKEGKLIIATFSGLGNQMFHYAFYKYLKLSSFNVYLDINSPQSQRQYQRHETFRLDYFQLNDINYATKNDVLEFITPQDEIFSRPFAKIIKTEPFFSILKVFLHKIRTKIIYSLYGRSKCWVEWERKGRGKKFYRSDLTKNTRAYMVGTYQEYFYLNSIRKYLINDFTFTQKMPEPVLQYYSEIIKQNSVSIHIRRGDYSTTKEFDICSIEYYKKAIDFISKNLKNPVFFVFSDDLQWVKNNFCFLNAYTIVDNSSSEKSDYCDLYLMTNCKHNIIPNSTFSWWAAWLNQNANKIVVCPEMWNGLDFIRTDEICPPEWKRVSNLL